MGALFTHDCSPSEQVGTLDVLVGLSDEMAKLDSFVERYI